MLDVRLDDVKEHRLERELESAWFWAVEYEKDYHLSIWTKLVI